MDQKQENDGNNNQQGAIAVNGCQSATKSTHSTSSGKQRCGTCPITAGLAAQLEVFSVMYAQYNDSLSVF